MTDRKNVSVQSQDMGGSESRQSNMDVREMARMGRIQELKRQFGPLAMIGFAIVLGATWQAVLADTLFSLANGGAAGTVYMYIFCSIGFMLTTWSLAEMASIAPTAGGQYHWVSELAPRSVQKPLSFFLGWIANFAWQCIIASSAAGLVTVAEAVAVLWRGPDFQMESWQVGLCIIGFLTITSLLNVVLISWLPTVEFFLLLLSVCLFVAFELIFLLMGPRGSAEDVFLAFNNSNGWPTTGLAVLIGLLNPLVTLASQDSVVHMGEELKNAGKWLPWSMILGQAFNFITAFLMLLTFLFRTGSIDEALADNPIMPFVAVLMKVTGSRSATAFLGLYIAFTSGTSNFNQITTASRQLYSFARDGGIPGSNWLCKVNKNGVPINSIIATWAFNCCLACIFFGSSVAYGDIASIFVVFLCLSYIVSISTLLYRRLQAPLPKAQFSMGRFGIPVNIGAILCLIVFFVMVFFPGEPGFDAATFNWACVIFPGFMLVPTVLYFTRQRHIYVPPVTRVQAESEFDDIIELDQKPPQSDSGLVHRRTKEQE